MEENQQEQQYQLLLRLFLSEEILNIQVTSDSPKNNVDEIVRQEPMLKRFVGYNDKIANPTFVGKGEQGFIFRFKYNQKDLCLKLFYDHQVPYNIHQETLAYISPFGCESRAFARLCDMHESGNWAVQCHGWMYLTDDQLLQLRGVSGRMGFDQRWDQTRWAIVKDFIADEPPSREDEKFQAILSNFCIPKRGHIIPRDVKKKNYRGDRIVDLGSTVTFPFFPYYANPREYHAFYDTLDRNGLRAWDK